MAILSADDDSPHCVSCCDAAQTNLFGAGYTTMFQNAIAAVGNYGEMYERSLTELLPRSGLNTLNRGTTGELYSMPLGAVRHAPAS